jgi:hypothetical protein
MSACTFVCSLFYDAFPVTKNDKEISELWIWEDLEETVVA